MDKIHAMGSSGQMRSGIKSLRAAKVKQCPSTMDEMRILKFYVLKSIIEDLSQTSAITSRGIQEHFRNSIITNIPTERFLYIPQPLN